MLADRLKITLPTSYMLSRLAWSCSYYHDVYAGLQYDGQSMLYWCKREVKFGAYWLLRTHVPGAAGRTKTWGADDKFVIMVRLCASAVVHPILVQLFVLLAHTYVPILSLMRKTPEVRAVQCLAIVLIAWPYCLLFRVL